MKLAMPKCAVSMRMDGDKVTFSCPGCKRALYSGTNAPRPETLRFIERHVGKHKAGG